MFVSGEPLLLSLMFVRKARAYLSEVPIRLYLRTSDYAGETCQVQALQLITNIWQLRNVKSLLEMYISTKRISLLRQMVITVQTFYGTLGYYDKFYITF
jgi:hypothetical protein